MEEVAYSSIASESHRHRCGQGTHHMAQKQVPLISAVSQGLATVVLKFPAQL